MVVGVGAVELVAPCNLAALGVVVADDGRQPGIATRVVNAARPLLRDVAKPDNGIPDVPAASRRAFRHADECANRGPRGFLLACMRKALARVHEDVVTLSNRRHKEGKTLPFKSQAQRRKFAQLLVEGKISNETFEEWNRETGRKELPERVADKRGATGRRATARKASRPQKKTKSARQKKN